MLYIHNMTIEQKIGNNLKIARQQKKLTQKEMAEAFKAKCAAEGIPQAQIIKKAIEEFLEQ